MLDTITTFFSNLVWSEWALIAVGVFIFWSVFMWDDDIDTEDAEEDGPDAYAANGEDTITCTVPWQKPIILTPNDFYDYDEAYTGIWSVTLRNWNSIFLPMEYTTIVDDSMSLTTI